jgi:ankyrin repeat protein
MTPILLDAGADVEATEELSGKRPLHAAATLGKTEVARLLIARGARRRGGRRRKARAVEPSG